MTTLTKELGRLTRDLAIPEIPFKKLFGEFQATQNVFKHCKKQDEGLSETDVEALRNYANVIRNITKDSNFNNTMGHYLRYVYRYDEFPTFHHYAFGLFVRTEGKNR